MQIISGKPAYVKQKMQSFIARGYVVANANKWSDGTITVKLVLVM